MAIDQGMNIDEVRALGEQLRNASQELNRILQLVQTKMGSTSWLGPDSSRFKNECWPNHRQRLQRITTDLNEFGQCALNNANEQEEASNAGWSGGIAGVIHKSVPPPGDFHMPDFKIEPGTHLFQAPEFFAEGTVEGV